MRLRTKRLAAVAAVAVSVLAGGVVRAQGPAQMSPQQQQQMIKRMQQQQAAAKEKLYKDLGVTAAQRKKLDGIETKYQKLAMDKQQAFLKKNPKPTQQQVGQLMAELQPLVKKSRTEAMAVLTKAQQAKYTKIEAERMQKMRQMQGGAPPR